MIEEPDEEPLPLAQCALCLNANKLVESHIIPNAYFRAMKRQSSGRLIRFTTYPDEKVKHSQDSWWEYLLCAECEQRFGRWETIWIKRLRDATKRADPASAYVDIAPFDYDTFRFFLLSILWRAAVSTRPEFSDVLLDAKQQEMLRLSLLAGTTAFDEHQVSTIVSKIIDARGVISFEKFAHFAASPVRLSRGGLHG